MAETASNIDELKVHLDTLFNFASQVSYTQNHLLPVIQAGKSLIGIKPEDPPKNLLKWLEGYVKGFSVNKDEIFGEKELTFSFGRSTFGNFSTTKKGPKNFGRSIL